MIPRRVHTPDPVPYADEAAGWEAAFEGGLAHDRRFVRTVLQGDEFDGPLLVARRYGCDDWAALEAAAEAAPDYDPFVRAHAAIDAIDADALARALAAEPTIVKDAGPWGDTLLQRALWKVDHGDWSWLPGPADDPDGRRLALVAALLAAGSDVDHANDRAWTPLHTAAYVGHLPLVETLLKHGASVHPSAQGDGGTPLCIALFWGHAEVAERLADVEIAPSNLRVAAGLGRTGLIESLGVNGDRREFYRPHEGFPFFRISDEPQQVLDEALVYAARNGRERAVARLLDWGADLNADVGGTTPLVTAASYGRTECCRALLDAGADLLGSGSQLPGATALHLAAWFDRPETVRFLVGRGARCDTREKTHDGTPLDWARYHQNADVVSFLEKNADLDILDAASAGRLGLVGRLLDADPSRIAFRDGDGDTALHAAAWYGRPDSVALLLERGADPTLKNSAGKTPLDLARERSHPDVVERLTGGDGGAG